MNEVLKKRNDEHERCLRQAAEGEKQGNKINVAPIVPRKPRRLTINSKRDKRPLDSLTELEQVKYVIKLFQVTNTGHIKDFAGIGKKAVLKHARKLRKEGFINFNDSDRYGCEFTWVSK
jgi:hypothetical protein